MKIRLLLITALGIILSCPVQASGHRQKAKANYELAERFSPKKINTMVHSTIVTPNWFKDSDKFWYYWKDTNGEHYYIVNPQNGRQEEIFDMEELAMQLTEITKDPMDAQHIPIEDLRLEKDKYFRFRICSQKDTFHFKYDYQTKELSQTTKPADKYPAWASISPDSSMVVYARNYNLYYTDMANLRKLMKDEKDSTIVEHRLTTKGHRDMAYGSDDYSGAAGIDSTERIYPNIYWSPDSRHFAICLHDMSQVKEFWVINSLSQPRPTLETYKYQMPGEPGPKTYLEIFNTEDKSSRNIEISAFKDQSIYINAAPYKNRDIYEDYYSLKWLGDNNTLYFTRSSRDLHRIDICRADIQTGEVTVVVEERLNTYNEVREPRLVNGGKELIQWSERNGWAHLYRYSTDGKLKNAITKGAFHVYDIESIDEERQFIYFTANGYDKNENPYYKHLYRVRFDGTDLKALNPGDYFSEVNISDDSKYIVDNISRVDMIPYAVLRDHNGRKIADLQKADFSQLFAAGYRFPETFKVKAADGVTDLWGVMYKPFDFDSTKVYPIIEYVYPGPQVEATNYVWSRGMNRVDRLSQLGFIVITVGHRGGHPDRSKWYHNYGYGNMRDYPLEDHKYAIQQLAARHDYIDINKVGIHGHSGGGFMSTAAICTYPDFYKVAVSCAGNHDNRIYNRWWSETHHGVEEHVSEAGDTTFRYDITVNQDYVKNLKGRLLLVHGDIDNNVHPANTLRVVDALIRANKRFDMLLLPGQRHGFGDMDEYFFWKMADYFSRYLIGDYENSVDIRQMNNN